MFLVWISQSKSVKKLQKKQRKNLNVKSKISNIRTLTWIWAYKFEDKRWTFVYDVVCVEILGSAPDIEPFLDQGLGPWKLHQHHKKSANFKDHNADKQSQWETFKFWICQQPTLLFLEYPSLIFSTALHRDVRYWNLWFCFRLLIEPSGSCLNANKSMELTKIIFLLKENIDTWIISQWKCQEQRKGNKKVLYSLKQSREAYVLSG